MTDVDAFRTLDRAVALWLAQARERLLKPRPAAEEMEDEQ